MPIVTRYMRFQKHPTLFRLLLLAVVLVALFLGYVFRYRAFVRSLRGFDIAVQDGYAEQAFPLLSRSQITQLGMAHREGMQSASSYALVESGKPAGVVRVGVFGCSFVNGKEAAFGQDFPSHLQRLFEADGNQDIQVLNFGVGAFGVQQSYLLWQYLAGEFELDTTVFSLYGFHRNRDNSFIMLNSIYAPVHGRYVLDGESIRLIEVSGADRRDAAKGYFRLIPSWNYLRFDAKTPPQIRALLPKGRELPLNPFYYRRDPEGELSELYGRIFADMASRSGRLLVLLNDRRSEDFMNSSSSVLPFGTARTSTENYTWDRDGLFRAPRNHPSALGYRVLAQETHSILTDRHEAHLIDVELLGAVEGSRAAEMEGGLSSFDDVYLSLNEMPAAVFVKPSATKTVETHVFEAGRFESVLDVSGSRNPLFIALHGEIPGIDLRLRFSAGGSPIDVVLGRISFVRGRHVGVCVLSWKTKRGDGWELEARPEINAISLDVVSEEEITNIRLELGASTVLRGELSPRTESRTRRISWIAAGGSLIASRGHPEQNAAEIAASEGGDFCITTTKKGRPDEHWCTRRWRLGTTSLKVRSTGIPPMGG